MKKLNILGPAKNSNIIISITVSEVEEEEIFRKLNSINSVNQRTGIASEKARI